VILDYTSSPCNTRIPNSRAIYVKFVPVFFRFGLSNHNRTLVCFDHTFASNIEVVEGHIVHLHNKPGIRFKLLEDSSISMIPKAPYPKSKEDVPRNGVLLGILARMQILFQPKAEVILKKPPITYWVP